MKATEQLFSCCTAFLDILQNKKHVFSPCFDLGSFRECKSYCKSLLVVRGLSSSFAAQYKITNFVLDM